MEKKQKLTLEDIEKKQVFTVPDQYFENLPANIRRRMNTKQEKQLYALSGNRYSISILALCLVLLTGWYAWFKVSQPGDPYQIISSVADTEIIDYLQLYELSQYEVIEVAASAEVPIENQLLQQTEISSELLIEEADEEILQDII
jgi:hypothetical protein